MTDKENLLVLNGITKRFPGVTALDGVSFDIRPGEVHALVGENGAGKSTLMKVLAGIYQPEEGEIRHKGEAVKLPTPRDALERGILLIHQELSLSPELSVAENIFLGAWPTNALGVLQVGKLNKDAQAALDLLGCDFTADTRVGDLTIARQQMVEIARVHAFKANIVVFDEPTASLTDSEKDQLFATINTLKSHGVGIVYISHKMDEIFQITDRITVLKDGKIQGTLLTKDTNAQEITSKMIGRTLDQYFIRAKANFGEEVLGVDKLAVEGLFEDISFSVRTGEVLGLYGLIGAGRTEIVETIFGIRKKDAGEIRFSGESVSFNSAREAIDKGLALVPESRKEQGLVLNMGGQDNITLPHLKMVSNAGIMDEKREKELYQRYQSLLEIKTTGPDQPVSNLSGGNQQKFVLAKWLCANPKLIILDEPTRGIDVGSKSAIHELIAGLAEQGLAVIVISSEMPEVIGVSHRILTIAEGRIAGEFTGDDMTEENLINAVSLRELA
ncbi:sugar ABC transporter ATP-binding protein [Enterovibrio paralichthyis]|uniref:sugar ABC transporter ATP-binding protein n=1 Tax=Enterovibrio paralichthyis TaxID=2853805 RepID=UPI001C464B9B|nr:sugar ABC transporter ATP-binding protein [Enterovibrio paralichthyis]MBV7298348.1 sugar ABC transporter ATP-binding protein [Enterovibrio paralichthyis]